MRVKCVLPVLGALALLVPVAKAGACIVNVPANGSAIVGCSGLNQVALSAPPYTSGANYVMELWGDGKSLHPQVQFYLAGFNASWSPQCSFSPQVGSVGWPAGGTNAPEFEGGGSPVIGGQRIAYINFSLAAPIPYGASVFLTGACPN